MAGRSDGKSSNDENPVEKADWRRRPDRSNVAAEAGVEIGRKKEENRMEESRTRKGRKRNCSTKKSLLWYMICEFKLKLMCTQFGRLSLVSRS